MLTSCPIFIAGGLKERAPRSGAINPKGQRNCAAKRRVTRQTTLTSLGPLQLRRKRKSRKTDPRLLNARFVLLLHIIRCAEEVTVSFAGLQAELFPQCFEGRV